LTPGEAYLKHVQINCKSLLPAGVTFGLGLALGLVFVEIILRLIPSVLPLETHAQLTGKQWLAPVGLPQFLAEYRELWEDDDDLRERMKPGLNTIIHGNPEYPAWSIKTDSLGLGPAGFRDTLPDQPPYALVLGDSFGFGVGVAQQEIWLERLENEIGQPIVNLSQVGASTLQEARIYARYGRQLPAQVVLWMFFQNDLKDNLRFADWLKPEANSAQAVRQPTRPCSGPAHRALKRYSLAYELILYWRRNCEYSAMTSTPIFRDERLSLAFCLDHDICDLDVQARMISDGWPLTRQALLETKTQTEQAGATLVIIIVPSKEQVYWDQFEQLATFPPNFDVDQMIEPVRDFCSLNKVYCLDLTEAFRVEARRGRQLYFPIDIHWNAQGHAVAASVVREYLRREKLLP
jgi:hypothetical protein